VKRPISTSQLLLGVAFAATSLLACSGQSFRGSSQTPQKTDSKNEVPEISATSKNKDGSIKSAPSSTMVKEGATQPVNITGTYLVSCVTSMAETALTATITCTLYDASMTRKAPEGEVIWGFDHPAKDQVASKITITPTPQNAQQDVIYQIKDDSTTSLVDLILHLKVTSSTSHGMIESKPYHPCGDSGNSCYNDQKALDAGFTVTVSEKVLTAVALADGLKIWKELGGSRILKASGLDEWQMQLNPDGKGFSALPFTNMQQIAGRVCPKNVYVDAARPFMTDNCLYHDAGNTPQTLNAAGSSQTVLGQMGLADWNTYNGGSLKWYVGNIQTCAAKGMRLPTLYETNCCKGFNENSYLPVADGNPEFSPGNGIPAIATADTYTWTATASTKNPQNYLIVNPLAGFSQDYTRTAASRCVLP
jgi:hypothetical protein